VYSVHGVMDGRGAWLDSVFVERLWRIKKHEEVCLRIDASVSKARASPGPLPHLLRYGSRMRQSCPANSTQGLLQPPAAEPGFSLTEAEIHLFRPRTLFRETDQPLSDVIAVTATRLFSSLASGVIPLHRGCARAGRAALQWSCVRSHLWRWARLARVLGDFCRAARAPA